MLDQRKVLLEKQVNLSKTGIIKSPPEEITRANVPSRKENHLHYIEEGAHIAIKEAGNN